MALAIKHNFVSAKTDGTDASLLRPSNWNDSHAITLATNNLVGRASAGAGAAEEIPTSAAVIALLASADLPTLIAALGISPPTTGDGRITLKTAPSAGWLMMDDGTFGNAGSGSSNRANVDCLALFTLIYTNITDAGAPVQTSAGGASTRAAQGTAATAWAALCRLTLPKQLGRAIVGAGTGAGLTARALGSAFGEESHLLTAAEMPAHNHPNFLTDPGHSHGWVGATTGSFGFSVGGGTSNSSSNTTGTSFTGITITNANTGGGGVHNNTQASAGWNVMVKL